MFVLYQRNSVGLAVLHNLVGKQQVFHFRSGRFLFRHRLQIGFTLNTKVFLLHQHTVQQRTELHRAGLAFLADQYDTIFLLFQYFQGIGIVGRGDDHFEENLVDFFCHFLVDSRVRDQDSAESRYGVAGKSRLPCFHHVGAGCDTTGIVMFQNGERQFVKLINQVNGSIDVEQVVVRDFLTVNLFEHIVELAIELSSLVRVFTVTQVHRSVYCGTEVRAFAAVKVVKDRRVVAG